jgi:hypothetical protein
MNTRNIKSKANITTGSSADSDSDINVSGTYNETNPGSMMSKANKVKKYNEKNR